MPHHYNDVSARLARVEEHLVFGAQNQYRMEEESRLRAADLGRGISDLEDRADGIDARVRVLEQDMHTSRSMWGMATTFAASAAGVMRYVAAIILVALVASGSLTADKLAAIRSIWGGSPPI